MSAQAHVVFSTHDQTLGLPAPFEFQRYNETWADVKMSGGFPRTQVSFPSGMPATADNRNTYLVGTIEVATTPGIFSGATASADLSPLKTI